MRKLSILYCQKCQKLISWLGRGRLPKYCHDCALNVKRFNNARINREKRKRLRLQKEKRSETKIFTPIRFKYWLMKKRRFGFYRKYLRKDHLNLFIDFFLQWNPKIARWFK